MSETDMLEPTPELPDDTQLDNVEFAGACSQRVDGGRPEDRGRSA
jgi:hypothetical protein